MNGRKIDRASERVRESDIGTLIAQYINFPEMAALTLLFVTNNYVIYLHTMYIQYIHGRKENDRLLNEFLKENFFSDQIFLCIQKPNMYTLYYTHSTPIDREKRTMQHLISFFCTQINIKIKKKIEKNILRNIFTYVQVY